MSLTTQFYDWQMEIVGASGNFDQDAEYRWSSRRGYPGFYASISQDAAHPSETQQRSPPKYRSACLRYTIQGKLSGNGFDEPTR